jgi:membrane-associated phospholipid phosphatase
LHHRQVRAGSSVSDDSRAVATTRLGPCAYDRRHVRPARRSAWVQELERVDVALYAAVAATPTPSRSRADGGRTDLHGVPLARHVAMPASRSFPSGHAASAFAFSGGVGRILPGGGIPLHALAMAVAYSRVHTGVHFPGDAVLGAVIGIVGAQATSHALDRRRN